MKIRTLTKTTAMLAAIGICTAAINAHAVLTFAQPLTLATPNIVGTLDGQPGNNNIATQIVYAQHLISMAFNSTDTTTIPGNAYKTSTTTEYGTGGIGSSSVTGGTANVGGSVVSTGWEYALAKYDGPGGGYVLYYLGGQGAILPQTPYNFWGTGTGANGLSGVVLFNAVTPVGDEPTVPEPTTVIAGLLMLLPFGASAMRIVRKNRTA
jgi:hypothetical protein